MENDKNPAKLGTEISIKVFDMLHESCKQINTMTFP